MLIESAGSGDRLAALQDLRDVLALNIIGCESPRDLAALSGRLQSVLAEIDELKPPEKKGDSVDEIAQRRAVRRGGASKVADKSKRSV